MFLDLSEFLSTKVKELASTSKKLKILFATYNNVYGYDNGVVRGTREGLIIKVQNGNLDYSPKTNLIWSPRLEIAVEGMNAMKREANEALSSIAPAIEEGISTDVDFIAIIYIGLSAFNESVKLARTVKQKHPNSKVIVTSCDCDLRDKRAKLLPLLKNKEIDVAVFSDECGGQRMMGSILKKFLKM